MKGMTMSAPTASRPIPRHQQPSAGRKSGQLEQRKQHKIERGETLQPKRTAETKPDAAEDNDDLDLPGRMASQDTLGDDQCAERDQGRRNQ
jgi:hypothetical protein